MKHLPAILFIAAAVLYAHAPAQAAPVLDFAVRVGCDFQQPERGLMDLHVLQGSTPLVLAMPRSSQTALTPDADTSVRMVIGPTETGSIYAVRTNYAIAGGGYAIDWPTIGTNSSGQAWFYTLLFDREGKTYWSGSGALYIDASTYTGPDGVDWIEYTTPNVGWANVVGDPADNAALVQYVEDHGGGSAEGYVPTYRTITINGVAFDLSANREWTVEGGGGTGWTNLAFSGTGNAITGATAAGTTLTLERGTIEGGSGGGGIEGSLAFSYFTNEHPAAVSSTTSAIIASPHVSKMIMWAETTNNPFSKTVTVELFGGASSNEEARLKKIFSRAFERTVFTTNTLAGAGTNEIAVVNINNIVDGSLVYVSSADGATSEFARVLTAVDAGSWTAPFWDGSREYIRSLCVYDGKLYAGQGGGAGDGDVHRFVADGLTTLEWPLRNSYGDGDWMSLCAEVDGWVGPTNLEITTRYVTSTGAAFNLKTMLMEVE